MQKRQRELGRIRMGDRGGKGQPQKLSEFRLTSSSRSLLDHAAALWGGEVRAWEGSPSEGSWELYTKTDTLPIVIPPGPEPLTAWYEQWSAGGCTHRCDGFRNHITDSPCSCSEEVRGTPRGCKATTRVNLMLPDLPDVGVWRLETKGINAAYELPGTIEVIQMASARGRFLTGRLRIEHRTSKKAGQTRRYIVPVIDLDVTVAALMSGEVVEGHSLESGTGIPVLEAGEAVQSPSSTSPSVEGGAREPNATVGDRPRKVAAEPGITEQTPPPVATISQAQIGRLMAVAREHDVSTEDLKLVVFDVAGVKSRKDIPVDRYDAVIQAISGEMVAPERQVEP